MAWDRAEVMSLISLLLSRCSNLVLVSEAKTCYTLEKNDMNHSKFEPMHYRFSSFESKIPISTVTLSGLTKICAHSLRHLHLNIDIPSFKNQKDFTRVLNALAQLRELRSIAMCSKQCTGDHKAINKSAEHFPADAFPHLERLVVDASPTVTQFFLYALRSVK